MHTFARVTPTALTSLPVAHAVHWAESLLYAAPFVLMFVGVVVANRRDRRRERAGPS